MKKIKKSIASIMAVCLFFSALCMVPSSAQQAQSKSSLKTPYPVRWTYMASTSNAKQSKTKSLIKAPYSVQWTYISATSVGLTKSYLIRLNISASTDCYSSVDHCGVTATLQKYNNGVWEYYDQWSASSTDDLPSYISLYETKYVISGTFRVVTSHSATSGNTTEYASMISNSVSV